MNNLYSDKIFDELLVMQCRQGDQKAYELLFKRWNERIVRHAFRVIKNKEVARDIAQEVWVAILKGMKRIKTPRHFGPWALRITHHKTVDYIRKQKREVKKWSPPKQNDSTEEQINFMLIKLNELPEKHKLMLTMFYLDKTPVAEIAYILDIPPGTVKSRLYHAREKLYQLIKSSHHE